MSSVCLSVGLSRCRSIVLFVVFIQLGDPRMLGRPTQTYYTILYRQLRLNYIFFSQLCIYLFKKTYTILQNSEKLRDCKSVLVASYCCDGIAGSA